MSLVAFLQWQKSFSVVFNNSYKQVPPDTSFTEMFSPYSVRMREKADQNNSEYEHFLRSDARYLSIFSPNLGKCGPE